jgi:hypothetical protein
MSYEEILETAPDGRFRVKLVLDDYPDEPYDDGQSPLMRIDRDGRDTAHVMATGRPLDADSYVEEAVARWGGPYSRDWPLVEKYLRAYHGVTKIETWHSGSYWYVTYDPAAWREYVGAPEGSVDMSEYRAYCEGDVWGWVVEKRVTWHADDDRDDMDTWEPVDSCWGYYGRYGANGEYLEQCARDALESAVEDAADTAKARLEYLRGELRAERISYGELAELQGLAGYIEAGDTELLEPAGVPESAAYDPAELAAWIADREAKPNPAPLALLDMSPEQLAAAIEDMQRVQRNHDADREKD